MKAFEHIRSLEDVGAYDVAYGMVSRESFERLLLCLTPLMVSTAALSVLMTVVRSFCGSHSCVEGYPSVDLVSNHLGEATFVFLDGSEPIATISTKVLAEDVSIELLRAPHLTRSLACAWHPRGARFEGRDSQRVRSMAPTVEVDVVIPESARPTTRPGPGPWIEYTAIQNADGDDELSPDQARSTRAQ